MNQSKTEEKFRLEFNEKQQTFHLDSFDHDAGTFGWVTVAKECTDKDFYIFEAFLKSKNVKPLTNKNILEAYAELKKFLKNLKEYNLRIE